ncbi:predicted protein [Nematostella vectensis]|uniref:Riboflavin transporter n=1 Tax=Nematostella vectensis TaxID=45351 RepID=A7SHT7_NEMVE|nr:predicted protein [Nematostella vectensis]|eukprot:XP_001628748.1 predicted protein [Nematostella vectensis]
MATYFLVMMFGIGAWIAVNGLWVELPIIVQEIPESWSLPSYLTVIIQLANIGPLAFTLGNKFLPRFVKEIPVTYALVVIGVLASALLAHFWKETIYIAGADRSAALLILAFFLSMVDCTSSVAFIPYMSRFPMVYLSPYFLGEGLSGLLPSLVALAQGVGEGASNERCVAQPVYNSSSNSTSGSWGPGPRFTPKVFFWFLSVMMACCGLAFLALNTLQVTKKQQVKEREYDVTTSDMHELQEISKTEAQSTSDIQVTDNILTTRQNVFLLVILAIVNGLSNGIIPAIQSYACIPYSYYIYHLTLTLSNIANPITCLMFPLLRVKSIPVITFLCGVYCVMCTYIIIIASQSPDVLLRCGDTGAALIVVISVSSVAMVTYCKVAISSLMRNQGRKKLLWFGISTQLGSCIGALSIFVPVNVYYMFKQY